jgi:hypothetical protein
MQRRQFPLLALLLGGGVSTASHAHHGWGSYDAQNPQTLTGPIKAVAFGNPHVHVDMLAAGKEWEVTLAPPFRMQARGAEAEILAVGKTVIAFGYPSRVKPAELRAEWIEVDGRRFPLR